MADISSDLRQVLVVDNAASTSSIYRSHLEAAGYSCELCADIASATDHVAHNHPFAVLLTLDAGNTNLSSLVSSWRASAPETAIIVVAANASINAAVDAVRAGAWDYLVKPVSRNKLMATLTTVGKAQQAAKPVSLEAKQVQTPATPAMLGTSSAMSELHKQIEAVASSAAPVFITGESGTGKELCAEAIHAGSARAGKPFIALNCGAIPRDLMESEIFGHLKGAFTGAIADREGAAVAADGGTLFLDEICEMDLNLQTKLLRFLQTGTVQPVGSANTRKVDIRIVCATNRNPRAEVNEGRFREDLFFRLHVLPIALKPLRERERDTSQLALTFLEQFAGEENKPFSAISDEALNLLMQHRWPGNVRELQNVIRQCVVMHSGDTLEAHMLPQDFAGISCAKPAGTIETLEGRTLWQIERDVIEASIARFAGSVPKAADALGISPSTIYRKRESWAAMPA